MTLFECDMEDMRLAEKGIVFLCPNRMCPLYIQCPYAERDKDEKGADDGK